MPDNDQTAPPVPAGFVLGPPPVSGTYITIGRSRSCGWEDAFHAQWTVLDGLSWFRRNRHDKNDKRAASSPREDRYTSGEHLPNTTTIAHVPQKTADGWKDAQRRAVLDSMTTDEIEAYLEQRRHDAYMSFGAEDGFERLVMGVDLADLILPTGTWVARDKDGTIRLAFGPLNVPHWNRLKHYYAIFNPDGTILLTGPITNIGVNGSYSLSDPDFLRQVRAWLIGRFAELEQSGLP